MSLARVMAIVNRTPDSFYDKGATFDMDPALQRCDVAIATGASIIDIGGVKAGPGEEVDSAEEIDRVVPTIARVHERHPEVLISVDTWRSEVAEAAIAAARRAFDEGPWPRMSGRERAALLLKVANGNNPHGAHLTIVSGQELKGK